MGAGGDEKNIQFQKWEQQQPKHASGRKKLICGHLRLLLETEKRKMEKLGPGHIGQKGELVVLATWAQVATSFEDGSPGRRCRNQSG